MPAAYSYDLRKKAMKAIDEGRSREEVAERFKVGKTTTFLLILFNKNGSVQKTVSNRIFSSAQFLVFQGRKCRVET